MAKKELTLAELVRNQRTVVLDIGVRSCAAKIGISAATLSRVENGKLPDVRAFALIVRWLGISADAGLVWLGV